MHSRLLCNSSTAPYAGRVTMYSGHNLRFSKVTRKDNGAYDCEVSGNGQFKETKVKLTVLGKDSFVITYCKHIFLFIGNLDSHRCHTIFNIMILFCVLNVMVVLCVRLYMWKHAKNWMFCPAVPPSPPVCRVPTSVTTGKTVILSCHDADGSPPPTYNWYKDNTLLPLEPNKIQAFKNYTYKLNPATGELVSYKL